MQVRFWHVFLRSAMVVLGPANLCQGLPLFEQIHPAAASVSQKNDPDALHFLYSQRVVNLMSYIDERNETWAQAKLPIPTSLFNVKLVKEVRRFTSRPSSGPKSLGL